MVPLQKWAAGLGLTTVAVMVSYLWLDRPIAMSAHGTTTQSPIFAELTYLPEPLVPMSLLALFTLGLWALVGQPLYKPHRVVLLCSISLIVAESFKNELKFIFGRTWPETWINGNPSLIHDGVYGFNFFHGGPGYASFPSGHTTAACAVASVLWICYPRLRALRGRCRCRCDRADRGRLSFPQRHHRRRLCRNDDRLVRGSAAGRGCDEAVDRGATDRLPELKPPLRQSATIRA